MESAFYGYYYASTDCLLKKWTTFEIEQFIMNYGGFEQINGNGDFRLSSSFCTIQLMDITSYDSWNSNDYNKKVTNYINITTSKELSAEIKRFFADFEIFLGFHISEESDFQ